METLKFTTYLKTATKKIKGNIFLTVPLFIFSLLFLPHIMSLPYLDGSIDFTQTVLYHIGGFPLYFQIFSSIHPPLKIFLYDFLYSIFGIHAAITTLTGYLWGILGIVSFFLLLKKLAPGSEKIGTLLLALNPLFLAAGLFSLTDYILTNLLLTTLTAYVFKKKIIFVICLSGLVLTKETGLLAPIIFLIIGLLVFLKNKFHKEKTDFFLYSIPLAAYYIWGLFLKTQNKSSWNDWIFAETKNQGTFYTIFHNITTLHIFNKFAAQHFLQLFFLNFNWIIIAISIYITIIILKRKENRKKIVHKITLFDAQSKTVLFILIFCILYVLTVLTLQTYTIPRYALPIIPFLILWFSVVATQLKNLLIRITAIFVIFLFTILGLFFSIDPIANALWGKVEVLGQNVYATNYHLSGNDGLTYNYQYLLIIKERTEIIHGKLLPTEHCGYIFPDPNNDRITAMTLGFSQSIPAKKCGLSSSQEF